jgi:hypothetical protein
MNGHSGSSLTVNDPGFSVTSYSVGDVVSFSWYNKTGKKVNKKNTTIKPKGNARDPRGFLLKDSCFCGDIEDMIAESEGTRECVYNDSLGIPTIGIGFNLRRSDA